MFHPFVKTFTFGTESETVNIDFNQLPETAQAFIINYGLTQYLNDGAAVGKDEYETEAERNAAKVAGIRTRADKLRAGTMSVRGGGTRTTDPRQKVMRDVATEILRAYFKSQDMKMPKGEELTQRIEKFWASEKNTAKMMPEVEKRLKDMAKKADSLGELEI